MTFLREATKATAFGILLVGWLVVVMVAVGWMNHRDGELTFEQRQTYAALDGIGSQPVPHVKATEASEPDDPQPADVLRIEVDVTAYCVCKDCCGPQASGRYCTGRKVSASDYAFALSPDLKKYFKIDESELFIPGYTPYDRVAVYRDSTSSGLTRTIDVIMTTGTAHERALDFGRRQMILCVGLDSMWLEEVPP